MKRRTLLTAVGTTAITAGCLGGSPPAGQPSGGADDDPGDDGTADGSDTNETGTGSDTDGTHRPREPVADVPCPSFDEEADETICWPDRDPSYEGLTVSASSVVFEPNAETETVDTVTVRLQNGSSMAVGLNPYAWSLHRKVDEGWERVAPDQWIEPWVQVESGGRFEWVLSVRPHPSPSDDDTVQITEDLPDGTYAFSISGVLGGTTEEGARVECVARMEVQRT